MGPKPLDPALPREVIPVPNPELKALICPVTQRPMQPAFVETLEVLARRPAVYFVKRYERTVFTSPAKTAPVYAEWRPMSCPAPACMPASSPILRPSTSASTSRFTVWKATRARRRGFARVCQVSLMAQLDERVRP